MREPMSRPMTVPTRTVTTLRRVPLRNIAQHPRWVEVIEPVIEALRAG